MMFEYLYGFSFFVVFFFLSNISHFGIKTILVPKRYSTILLPMGLGIFYVLIMNLRLQDSWRTVVATAVQIGIPVPTFSAALAFYDGYGSAVLPANLIQAQRWVD